MNSSSTPRRTQRWCCIPIAVLALQAVMLADAAASGDDPPVQAGWDVQSWRSARAGFTLIINQAALPDGGRLAVFVDATEVTALLRATADELVYPADAPPLPAGERRIKVFIASGDKDWQPVAEFPLKILTRSGFEVAEVKPTVDLTGKARLDSSFESTAQAPADEASRLGTMQLGMTTRHLRDGLAFASRVNVLGVTRQAEALRFAQRGSGAPRIDLADYLIAVEGRRAKFALGHVSFDGHRQLAASLRGRGIFASLNLLNSALTLTAAAVSGSDIVGWSNPTGLGRSQHRLMGAVLAAEAFPAHPGRLRLEATFFDGAVEPIASFTQGAVLSAEESAGVALRLLAATPTDRLTIDAGWASSTFRPAFDPQLEGGLSVTPLATTRRYARYVDVGVVVLSGATNGGDGAVDLRLGLHHERVDPLYRSLGARPASDSESNAADLTARIGSAALHVAVRESFDNLQRLASVLSTTSRQWSTTASLPLASLISNGSPAWPALTVAFERIHQFGRGLPVNGEFEPSHVPDQVSRNATGGLEWQGDGWHLSLQRSWTHQDNRQPGRARADFETFVDSLSATSDLSEGFAAGVELSQERFAALEQNRIDRTRRAAVNATWRLSRTQTILASVARTASSDSLGDSKSRGFDGDAQWTLSFGLAPLQLHQARGTVFVRYANRRLDTRDRLFELSTATRQWAIHTGFNLSLY